MKLLLVVVCLLPICMAAGGFPTQDDSNATLGVRIVPTSFTDKGTRNITLIDSSQHFSVVLTNIGKDTIRLWRESCSWGYFNLSFEVQYPGGKQVLVTRKQRVWEKNYPDWMIIPPGDHLVIEVTFDPNIWQNSPLPAPGQQQTVSLRAVYESADSKEAKANKVWSGRAVSPANTYTLFR